MSPLEVNARKLIGVLVRHPTGATSEELRRLFEQDSSLNRQSYYNALRFCRAQGWLVGGGGWGQLYELNPDRSWEEPSTGEIPLEKEPELQTELERLRDLNSGSANGVALVNLLEILSSSSTSIRQKLKAAAVIVGYRVQDDGVIEFTRRSLESLVANPNTPTDYRVEGAELLRKSEAPRASYREGDGAPPEPAEAPIPLAELLEQRKRRADELQARMVDEILEEQRAAAAITVVRKPEPG